MEKSGRDKGQEAVGVLEGGVGDAPRGPPPQAVRLPVLRSDGGNGGASRGNKNQLRWDAKPNKPVGQSPDKFYRGLSQIASYLVLNHKKVLKGTYKRDEQKMKKIGGTVPAMTPPMAMAPSVPGRFLVTPRLPATNRWPGGEGLPAGPHGGGGGEVPSAFREAMALALVASPGGRRGGGRGRRGPAAAPAVAATGPHSTRRKYCDENPCRIRTHSLVGWGMGSPSCLNHTGSPVHGRSLATSRLKAVRWGRPVDRTASTPLLWGRGGLSSESAHSVQLVVIGPQQDPPLWERCRGMRRVM